ncbi:MAG: hypothetical protein E6J09_02440 [Chloroflexi bacterium]|nr:MAG: hypothetical protein E6J09_02440 [Chloroflexota bacterium]
MSRATSVRTVVRLLCLSIWLLIALYWVGVTRGGDRSASEGVGLQALLVLFVLVSGLWIVGTLSSRVVSSRPLAAILLGGAVTLALFAAVGPWLLNEWIRGGAFTSYGWVIRQGYPCSAMGSGPGTLWVFGTSWIVSFAALAYALVGRDLTAPVAAVGIALGMLLLTVTAAAMFPAPEVFAAALGCR